MVHRTCWLGPTLTAVLLLTTHSAGSLAQERVPFIINGVPTDAFPAVGVVGEASVGGFCTGSLIDPRHVLTAAHCAEAILMFGNAQSGTFTVGGRTYLTSQVFVHPLYDPRLFTDDVAVLELSEPVTNVDPLPLSLEAPAVGDAVVLVGFGGQGTPEAGSDGSFGLKLTGTTIIDGVSPTEIYWEFDEPSEGNPAPGDSGSPVLWDDGTQLVAVGIVSSGTAVNAELGDVTFSMRVDAYSDWISDVVLVVDPVDEGEADVDASDGGQSCQRPAGDGADRHKSHGHRRQQHAYHDNYRHSSRNTLTPGPQRTPSNASRPSRLGADRIEGRSQRRLVAAPIQSGVGARERNRIDSLAPAGSRQDSSRQHSVRRLH